MPKLVPKAIPDELWKQLTPRKSYGIRANADDDIHLRFGLGGMYVSILNAPPNGKVVNAVSIEEGNMTVIGKISGGDPVLMGRGSDCAIKVAHAVMSRQHLELRLDGNILVVKDLGSTNGTYFYGENIVFDIDEYIKNHPPEKAAESTMDELHEAFGSVLNDFLKRYQESQKGTV